MTGMFCPNCGYYVIAEELDICAQDKPIYDEGSVCPDCGACIDNADWLFEPEEVDR